MEKPPKPEEFVKKVDEGLPHGLSHDNQTTGDN
jgi:hypothetical protein